MNESAEQPKIPRQLTDRFTNLTKEILITIIINEETRRAGGQAGRRAGGRAGRQAGGRAGRRAGREKTNTNRADLKDNIC